jgi:hypothetical protein
VHFQVNSEYLKQKKIRKHRYFFTNIISLDQKTIATSYISINQSKRAHHLSTVKTRPMSSFTKLEKIIGIYSYQNLNKNH